MLLAGITTAGAATVVQTQNVTFGVGFSVGRYSWDAFDADLGTLTSAVFVVNGTYSGSVAITAHNDATTVSNPQFLTVLDDNPAPIFTYTNFSTSPAFATIATDDTQSFTIQGSPVVTLNSGNLLSTPDRPSNYYTSSSFAITLGYHVVIDSTGGTPEIYQNTMLNGTISLTYTYTPAAVEPVPEISTVTMGGAGGLLLLGIAARSRRRQQPSDSVPA